MIHKSQFQSWLDTAYTPEMGSGVDAQERAAKAAEYAAYHLYQISEKLDKLIEETGSLAALIVMYGGRDNE